MAHGIHLGRHQSLVLGGPVQAGAGSSAVDGDDVTSTDLLDFSESAGECPPSLTVSNSTYSEGRPTQCCVVVLWQLRVSCKNICGSRVLFSSGVLCRQQKGQLDASLE